MKVRPQTYILGMLLTFTITLCAGESSAQTATAVADVKFRQLTKPDTPAPGMPAGITLSARPSSISIGADGKVAGIFELRGAGVKAPMQAGKGNVPNHEALYVETDDGLKPLLRTGDAVLPDHPDLQVFRIRLCSMGEGNIVAMAQLGNEPRIPNPYCAIFTNRGGDFRPVIQTGATVDGGELMRLDDPHRSAYSSEGRVTFRSRPRSPNSPPSGIAAEPPSAANQSSTHAIVRSALQQTPMGLWSGPPEDLRPIAKIGQPVPGKPGDEFKKIGSFVQNTKGTVAFETASGKPKGNIADHGVWLKEPDAQPRLVSDNIEGIPAGARITVFEQVQLNDAQQIVVYAGYQVGTGRDKVRGNAIVFIDGDGTRVLLKSGDPIPGTDRTANLVGSFKLSSTGMVAAVYYFGEKGKTPKTGLMLIDPANPKDAKNIIAQGDAAPGAGDGVTIGKLGSTRFQFDAPDTLAIFSYLSNKANAVFLSRSGGTAEPLLLNGMEIEIGGNKRTVKQVNQLVNSTAYHQAETGYLPLYLRFTDRTSAAVIAELPKE